MLLSVKHLKTFGSEADFFPITVHFILLFISYKVVLSCLVNHELFHVLSFFILLKKHLSLTETVKAIFCSWSSPGKVTECRSNYHLRVPVCF